MNYVTSTYIKSFNPYRAYDTTSKPTLAQVTSYIPSISAEMTARMIGVGISAPISTSPATDASRYLKYICALGCAGITESAAFSGGHKQDSEHGKSLLDMYESKMKAIEKNPNIITAITTGVKGSFDSYEYSDSDKARTDEMIPFYRDEDNW